MFRSPHAQVLVVTLTAALSMAWEEVADFPCLVACSALEKYLQQPAKGKHLVEREWTPMAAILQHSDGVYVYTDSVWFHSGGLSGLHGGGRVSHCFIW